MTEIKIVRLNTGEDIIAEYSVDKRKKIVQLINPMHIIFKRTPSGSIMMIFPWLPVEILKENFAVVDLKNVLTIADPKDDLITHYHKLILQAEKTLAQSTNIMDQFEEIDEDEDDELTDDETNNLVEAKKNNLLH
jgi:hypothetical protein